jgi:Flp pilus assembly protein TadG
MHIVQTLRSLKLMGRGRIKRKAEGQALVEFTIILAPLMMIVLAVLAFWPVFTARDAVAFAAASGAHEAAITGGNADRVEDSVDAMLSTAAFDLSTRTVSVQCTGGCARYQPVTVRVSVKVQPWIRLPFMPKSFTVSSQYSRASEVDGGPGRSAGSSLQSDNPSTAAPAWDVPGASTHLPGSADQ